ncbi:MAG TPA: hypothetical protein VGM91_12130 [Conexibacter sp.]|jgi:hypothetical protein
MTRWLVFMILALGLTIPVAAAAQPSGSVPVAHAAAVCSDFPNQAAAQAAANTRDADGDGIYCESLPCPCAYPNAPVPTAVPTVPPATPTPVPTPSPSPTPTPVPKAPSSCSSPTGVQTISFSRTKYRDIRAHALAAIKKGWPSILVINREGASERRSRLLESWPTRTGKDRDEYPPAVGRGRGAGLTKGADPKGWRADVAYVPSGENRSHGSSMGTKLRRFCDGVKFKYAWY